MRYAVIPARGGSKRIPRKNIRPFAGRPMILHSILAARESGLFDAILVSTDDDEIAEIARDGGAEVPFRRPADLSDDQATSVAVVTHAVAWLRAAGRTPAEVCCLYATAPFVRPADLRAGLAALDDSSVQFCFPVTAFDFPIQRALARAADGSVTMREPEHQITRSQDLQEYVHDAGQFYWGRAEAWEAGAPVYAAHSRTILMPRYLVQDIDTPEDWRRAELMFEALARMPSTSD
ncbi:pseudaminic acid cytidylyltransferase [Rhodovulum euryhalinum]|uniref:N-acylneuraminate cytidylyltransferase n=1 Tax=Rhodovulum euryhalinum TaxID=35805 RepID=A0A4R2KLQ2_9RHOB|nr:pseudaminic acid cytidylyltransferase [Rhodovulum euryhalinum]TCO71626.1 N-acylneuraminate cytidylyltransferase [Rhodovulum euryhalinum]